MPIQASAAEFTGFPAEAFRFFDQLATHNNRDWFHAHKETYQESCREPLEQLIAALGGDVAKSHITRANRDTRFSRDKSPYRTYIAAGFGDIYIQGSSEGMYVGAGIYRPEPPALDRMRKAIDDARSGAALEKIVAALRRKGYKVETHDRLASAPRGYQPDHPRIELLRMKDIVAGKRFPRDATLSSKRVVARVKQVTKEVQPLADWLRKYVTLGRNRRD